MNSVINTTQEYDRWWRDVGQFLQPADTSQGEQLELLRAYGFAVHQELKASFEDVRSDIQGEVEDKEKALRKIRELILEIKGLCE